MDNTCHYLKYIIYCISDFSHEYFAYVVFDANHSNHTPICQCMLNFDYKSITVIKTSVLALIKIIAWRNFESIALSRWQNCLRCFSQWFDFNEKSPRQLKYAAYDDGRIQSNLSNLIYYNCYQKSSQSQLK